jgi:hypothetical protein
MHPNILPPIEDSISLTISHTYLFKVLGLLGEIGLHAPSEFLYIYFVRINLLVILVLINYFYQISYHSLFSMLLYVYLSSLLHPLVLMGSKPL